MHAAIIPADTSQPVEIKDFNPGVTAIQEVVGGYFQVLTLADLGVSMYMDEEGKFKHGAVLNSRATALAAAILREEDFIVGDVLLLGAPDEHGNDTDLPEAVTKLLAVMAV